MTEGEPAVRIRGIYTTALTKRLDRLGYRIVDASDPIRERFDRPFPPAPVDATLRTTSDRQGVQVSGRNDAVDQLIDDLTEVARDTFAWRDPTPAAAVYQTIVTTEEAGGAVLDLGAAAGYLPYGATDEYIETGDELQVQVDRPTPPWRDRKPRLTTEITISGPLVSLVRGAGTATVGTPPDADREEFGRITDLLDAEPPPEWGIRWERGAGDADLQTLDRSLAAVARRATAVDRGIEEAADDAGPDLAAPMTTGWIWFGRESRFALDADRRVVTDTLDGHHRIKAGAQGASDAVDFAERLQAAPPTFPYQATVEQFGPEEGATVSIRHGKPNGDLFTLGQGQVVSRDFDNGQVTVRREIATSGTYDGLGVDRVAGDTATTTFAEGRAWAPTVYRSADGDLRGTYVNVATPIEIFPDAVRYVDLHVDVLKYPDGTVEIVDEDELAGAVEAGHVSEALAERARTVAAGVADGLR